MSKQYKEYLKTVKKHRKILVKEAKRAYPFDYEFGLDYFIKFLEFMKEYYEKDNNVHSDDPMRLTQINQALTYYRQFKEGSEETQLHYWNMFWDCIKTNLMKWWD